MRIVLGQECVQFASRLGLEVVDWHEYTYAGLLSRAHEDIVVPVEFLTTAWSKELLRMVTHLYVRKEHTPSIDVRLIEYHRVFVHMGISYDEYIIQREHGFIDNHIEGGPLHCELH